MVMLNKKNYLSINYSRRSRRRKSRHIKNQDSFSRTIILCIILIVTIIIIAATIFAAVFTNENRTKLTISDIAADYYENYFYENLLKSEEFQKNNPGATLEEYQEKGLSPLTLRDLLLYDDQKHYNQHDFLTKFCDENKTLVKFYPESPYERNSYRTEFVYSCNF